MAIKTVNEFSVKESLEFIEAKLAAGACATPILLAGAPGIGKTEGIQAIAKKFDTSAARSRRRVRRSRRATHAGVSPERAERSRRRI